MKLPIDYTKSNHNIRRLAREQYAEEQGGSCYYCGSPLSEAPGRKANRQVNRSLFPKGFFANPVHLHHSHKTGMTIGAVHAYCNAVLWQYHGE